MHIEVITLKGMRLVRARIVAERVREMAHKGVELTFAIFVIALGIVTLIQFIHSPFDSNLPPLPPIHTCPFDN